MVFFSITKSQRLKSRALWTLIASFLLISAAQPTAYGLDFPMSTSLSLPASAKLVKAVSLNTDVDLSKGAALYTQLKQKSELFASQMALVASISRQVEMARKTVGAKKVAKVIAKTEYDWGDKQFLCLNRLWTKESHWNYRAHNKRSGCTWNSASPTSNPHGRCCHRLAHQPCHPNSMGFALHRGAL